jgi:plastocyanin
MNNKRVYQILVALVCAYFTSAAAFAAEVITVDLKDNIFEPSVITISENTKIKLIIVNHDDSPEEFDSFDLNREKVIFANSSAILFIGPLPKGTYHFFGEYHPETAIGKVIVTNCETMRIGSSEELATC